MYYVGIVVTAATQFGQFVVCVVVNFFDEHENALSGLSNVMD